MIGRALLWASEKPRMRRFVTEGRLTQGVVRRFVAGDELEDAIAVIKDLNARGIGGILDLLGEGVEDPAGAASAADAYLASIRRIEESGIDTTVSMKPTQLGLAFDKEHCIEHFMRLASEAQRVGAGVEIDIEQSEYVADTIEVFRALRAEFTDIRLALQAYLRRTPSDLENMKELRPKIRLVKGAYAEPEELAFQKRSEIDAQYAYLSDWLMKHGTDPGIATHDGELIEHVQKSAASKDSFEIQMLYGIRRDLQESLAREGYRVRVYVPFGSAWYPYLMRRMAERPANVRFFLRALVRN